ncbi:HPP family protein [Dongia mobilis]|uniref:HPP family protein n=1 Tax=Dongia mobilis TaxID=578943 RepID=UPI001AAD85FC|nr:HPP family protein [Dongia mobilis]
MPLRRPWRLFAPILAGATLRERLIGCLGVLIGVAATSYLSHAVLGDWLHLPFLVAPVGASALLLFAVPASPMAQPWPIIGGNTISAAVGVAIGHMVPDPSFAAGIAVALAFLAMSLTRSLHPPGGAAALSAVLGGQTVAGAGLLYPFIPVGANSLLLVAIGIAVHRFTRRAYPHVAPPAPANTRGTGDLPPQLRAGFQAADIDAALARLDETFDIDRADLDRLFREVEHQALLRAHSNLACQEIMSRDVVTVAGNAAPAAARDLLLRHNVRTLPVVDSDGRLLGSVGLRELAAGGEDATVAALASPAATAPLNELAMNLVPRLSDGRSHAVVITDENGGVCGLITQTDLLAALARALVARIDYSI